MGVRVLMFGLWLPDNMSAEDWADDEARFFRVADRFVQELGWLG